MRALILFALQLPLAVSAQSFVPFIGGLGRGDDVDNSPCPGTPISYPSTFICNTSVPVSPIISGTTGGTFTSTAGLSIDASTGTIIPAASAVGSYEVTYSFYDGLAAFCPTSTIIPINIGTKAAPVASVTATPNLVCQGGTSQLQVNATSPPIPYYCVPSIFGGCGNFSIQHVSVAGIDRTSTCDNFSGGYFSSGPSGTLVAGSTNFCQIGIDPFQGNYWNAALWIDYDQDGLFELPSERVSNGLVDPSVDEFFNGWFTVPATARNGVTRLRVIASTDFFDQGNACASINEGEYEDYNVTISGGVDPMTYSWSPATFLSSTTVADPMATAMTSTTPYTVTVTDVAGCSTQGAVAVTVGPPIAATATATCAGTEYSVVWVNLTSMGIATSIAIQVDNDAGGPNGYTTVQTVTAIGNYGPFGVYASGSPVNVRLVPNVSASCSLDLNNVVAICTGPGSTCTYSSTTPSNIVDNTTVTNTITVPSLGGQTVADLNVFVNITHTWVADLLITLQSPSGTTITLMASGSCGDFDNMTVEFNQQAVTAIGVTCPMTNIYAIPSASLAGFNGQLMQGTWTLSVQDVGNGDVGTLNSWCLIPTLGAAGVQVSPKVFLEGPYNATTGIMSDAVRAAALVPSTQPYTGLGYTFTGSPGPGGTLAPAVLSVTGNNAIVDWMVVELRNTASPTTVVASCAALVQRDGDVVALDGTSPVSFSAAAGNYYVALRHRNHLGVMTLAGVALSSSPTTVDFRSAGTNTYGTSARKSVTGTFPTQALWAGDVSFNGEIKYTGAANDRDPILVTVGSTTPNNTVNAYSTRDVNMDGTVKYTGSSNDRDPILVNVGSTTPNNVRVQQLP